MSWFTTYVEHPFVAAIEGLTKNPAITANPDATKAVADAKAQAQAVATVATSAAASVISDAQAAEDPAINALGTGLIAAVDAFAIKSLGPVGGEIAVDVANPLIALGEDKAHSLLTAAFAHLRAQLPAPKPT